jgi:hypothetical protein
MSAHNNGSGPRSNSYSVNRFANWSEYEPWWLEIQAVFKRFDGKIAKRPVFPKIIALPTLEGFIKPCSAGEVEAQLRSCPIEFLKGLRAVFILSGTTKQLKSWGRATTSVRSQWGNWGTLIGTAMLFGLGHLHGYPPGLIGACLATVFGLGRGRCASGQVGFCCLLSHTWVRMRLFTVFWFIPEAYESSVEQE